MRPEVGQFSQSRGDIETLVICAGNPQTVAKWEKELDGVVRVIPDQGSGITARYGVALLPYCIGVDADGVVRTRGLGTIERALT